ncbi:hypothetical protein KP003_16575 [Geomonas nitrogeniifigens]|uniref:hypothetical protein n=1 Tax=Geomonas diazotrophica TaxID=2843197 RepID=UPI001C2BB3FE|nr:hypothetical protein [Geomonas nitrogeniifigens]QXE85956.1 hypothetical protein KP003_16575 [Geomonas nitrogeniifigens]
MRICIFAALIFLAPSIAFSAPVIDSASANPTSITIIGSGFGANSGASTPIFWDNFEGGADNTNLVTQLAGSVPWALNNLPTAKYRTNQAHSGTKSAYALHSNNNHWSHFTVGSYATPIPDSLTYYHSFWFRYNTPQPLGTHGETKLIRMFGSLPTSSPDMPYVKTGDLGNDWWATQYRSDSADTVHSSNFTGALPTQNVWHKVEGIYKQSSTGGVADGSIKIVMDGVTQINLTNIVTRASSSDRWIEADFFGGMTNWDMGATGLTWEKWIDDAYLSKTWQRVEICNIDRTHCELQPVTSWTDTSITATVNQGSFADGSAAYLFAVDASGAVSSGKSFTFGATAVSPPTSTTGTRATFRAGLK